MSLSTEVGPNAGRDAAPVGARPSRVHHLDLGPDDLVAGHDGSLTWSSDALPGPAAVGATSVVVSWEAAAPEGTWVEVDVSDGSGADDDRFRLARWSEGDDRTTVGGQDRDGVRVRADELHVDPDRAWASVRVHVRAHTGPDAPAPPDVRAVHVLVSGEAGPDAPRRPVQPAGPRPAPLAVPPVSQQDFRDLSPHLDGGGQHWCSPTSVTMVLRYWGAGGTNLPDVPQAAEQVWDPAFGGTGNWAFATAYAARRGLRAFVTRLAGVDDLATLTAAGVPVVVSVSFTREELDGAGYDTTGHLLVVSGVDDAGDVVVDDPASHGHVGGEVRTTYDRGQLDRAWEASADRLAYVIHPREHPLPPSPDGRW